MKFIANWMRQHPFRVSLASTMIAFALALLNFWYYYALHHWWSLAVAIFLLVCTAECTRNTIGIWMLCKRIKIMKEELEELSQLYNQSTTIPKE